MALFQFSHNVTLRCPKCYKKMSRYDPDSKGSPLFPEDREWRNHRCRVFTESTRARLSAFIKQINPFR